MKTDKFNYDLPEHLIAQYPSSERTDSKLLVAIESIQHQVFQRDWKLYKQGRSFDIKQNLRDSGSIIWREKHWWKNRNPA
jgi:hypothetical protein